MSSRYILEIFTHDLETTPRKAQTLEITLFGRWNIEISAWVILWDFKKITNK